MILYASVFIRDTCLRRTLPETIHHKVFFKRFDFQFIFVFHSFIVLDKDKARILYPSLQYSKLITNKYHFASGIVSD